MTQKEIKCFVICKERQIVPLFLISRGEEEMTDQAAGQPSEHPAIRVVAGSSGKAPDLGRPLLKQNGALPLFCQLRQQWKGLSR